MKKLYRCRWNKKVSGVLGGLGIYLNLDPTILRLIFLALIIPTGVFVLPIIYLIAALVIPEGPKHYIQPSCKHLYKSNENRVIAGVCGGIADFFGIDPTIIRIICIVLFLITAVVPIVFLYFAAAIIIPNKPAQWR